MRHIIKTILALTCFFSLASPSLGEGKDFHDQDLKGKNFDGQGLNDANFSDAILISASFKKASLKRANFKAADLNKADFREADLTGADFREVVGFLTCATQGAIFTKANLQGVSLFVPFQGVFRGTDLRKATLTGVCTGCDFTGADLRGANLRAVRALTNLATDMRPKRAIFDDDTAWPDGFDPVAAGAVLAKPEDNKDEGKKVETDKKVIVALPLLATTATDYSHQDLQNKDFTNENLNNANFQGADLRSAKLTNATCKNANFRDANLEGARLADAKLEGADFTGANLVRADLSNAKARGTKFAGAVIHLAGAAALDIRKLNLDYRAEQTLLAAPNPTSGSLSFQYGDMRESTIAGNAEGVDFRDVDLCGADLTQVDNLDKARLKGVKYDKRTQWKLDPEKAGAILVSSGKATKEPATTNSPFIGKWGILKGEGDAPDNGSLKISADHTYEWQYSLSADPPCILSGKWEEAGEQIVIKKGELGETWNVRLVIRGHETELNLESQTKKKRLAVTGAK